MRKVILISALISVLFTACFESKKRENDSKKDVNKPVQTEQVSYNDYTGAVFKLETYDGARVLESGCGVFISEDVAVTNYSHFLAANKAYVVPFNSNKKYEVTEYVAVDRINDLILIKVSNYKANAPAVWESQPKSGSKSVCIARPRNNTLPLHKGKLLGAQRHGGNKFYKISNNIHAKQQGIPVFVNGKILGIGISQVVDFEKQNFAIPAEFINQLIAKNDLNNSKSLEELKVASSSAQAKRYKDVKGLLISTEVGDITIRLYNETPAYRDNFIRLTQENYFDSLLIHRVIKGFGIQSGAADTRYATATDVVGWKGPGYTLPAHIVPKYFHRRGVVGSPRKPDRKNMKRRSDGSQFYIVSGRKYTDDELDDIEKENNYKFTRQQREYYKTTGGAPHLDGTYTVFGEVTSGMDIVDAISLTPVDGDYRPRADIRIKTITIIK
ncbi:peptidylprolyl isomerase [Puteibacter caeruleilacunae]|nr:peptidylprolyl isomerase [Puteibacter caeruleilacunae]